ncbi:MAG: DUF6512 family protein [Candidatus Hodarchaeota archaeon]
MKKTILKWEVLGAVFIILIGALFHFMFELLNYWRPLGAIFPVNESVWEHLKLPYWPLIIFSLIEYKFIKDKANNIILGKTISFLISIGTILIIFYSYTAILGTELLILDILSFIFGVIIGQFVSYRILIHEQISKWYINTSWIIFFGFGIMFTIFTYFPPTLPIFQDPETSLYGIIEHFIKL